VLNISQEIFLLFFSILFGVMLSTLPPGSFPTDTFFSKLEWKEKGEKEGGWVNTGKFWNKSKKRFFLSFAIVNILPIIYFALYLMLLRDVQFELTIGLSSIAWLVFIPLLASTPLGFYRIYAAILYKYEKIFVDRIPQYVEFLKGRDLASPKRHALGSLFYFIWPILLALLLLCPIILSILN